MPSRLQDELRQRKPFETLRQEAYLNVARTDAVLRAGVARVLAPHDLSLPQYNVLRILRGAGAEGLCRNEVRDRLVTRMPDVSRLLDRLEALGFVRRVRSTDDHRVVNTTLTEQGRTLVDELDDPLRREHEQQLGHMSAAQLHTFIELATLARTPP